jgi:hypothetical protein
MQPDLLANRFNVNLLANEVTLWLTADFIIVMACREQNGSQHPKGIWLSC